jgi:bifunctional UDP-N-acetylglucosamine pyrophosphorylase/glucosamine-1-phosphate N-acetyltransferase
LLGTGELRVLCVIPAAGRGTRLGGTIPKVLVEIEAGSRILDAMVRCTQHVADKTVLVVSQQVLAHTGDPVIVDGRRVAHVIQEEPTGMLDAITTTCGEWEHYDVVVVIWGDQVNLNPWTVLGAIRVHGGLPDVVVVPTVNMANPYVQYDFGQGGDLLRIRETREGDTCDASGLGDVGLFVMSSQGLQARAEKYRAQAARSDVTGEVNFLPFLVYLHQNGWDCRTMRIADEGEARGVNTPADLEFARKRRGWSN